MRQAHIGLAVLLSAGALGGALAFQYLGGYQPCEMCMWQRYAHVGLIVTGLLALLIRKRAIYLMLIAWPVVSLVFALLHSGIERGLWQGLTRCTANTVNLDIGNLTEAIAATTLIRCDEIAWSLVGLSMANFNVLISLGLIGVVRAGIRGIHREVRSPPFAS